MIVSADWLKQFAKTRASAHEIAERLTMQLNEVDEIRSLDGLSKIVVGEVTGLKRHAGADKLWIAQVAAGRATYQIVTGADNLFAGAKVPLAKVGVTLTDGLKIAKRTFRGETSEGMLCSPRELGAGEDHAGIWLLPADAVTGQPLDKALAGRRDTFDLDVPANRADCMGHIGVAREVAAAFGTSVAEPKLRTSPRQKPGALTAKSTDSARCARFSLGRIRGVQNGESPVWLRERLASVGLRPVSAVVDITNYVMLETGQPLHAYDASKVTGVMIYARPSRNEETVKTLDGKTRKLPKGTLVIADRTQALGIAGIMGGASSEVTRRTNDIVLECANFDSAAIRRASRTLGLSTDASTRFEKALPPDGTWPALRRAIDLLREICGGELVQLTDDYPRQQKIPTVMLDSDRLKRFLGTAVSPAKLKKPLTTLGFSVRGSGKRLSVSPPWWRPDVQNESDVFEEAVRLSGYEAVPETLPKGQLTVPSRPPLVELQKTLAQEMVGAGYTEILTHSLVGTDLLERSGYPDKLVAMANPLSEDHAYLRGSMSPRHLEAVADNLRWRDALYLFEVGTVFEPTGSRRAAPREQRRLTATLATKTTVDQFAELRAALQRLVESIHLKAADLSFRPANLDRFAPGRQFEIFYKRSKFGWIGQYRNAKRFKAGRIYQLSVHLDKLLTVLPAAWTVENPSAYPPVYRDFSWFVPDTATYAEARKSIEQHGEGLVRWVGDAEEYRKDGKRSLKVRVAFGSPDRTLKDAEVDRLADAIVQAGKVAGWKIR